jgi:cell division protein FtsL
MASIDEFDNIAGQFNKLSKIAKAVIIAAVLLSIVLILLVILLFMRIENVNWAFICHLVTKNRMLFYKLWLKF